MNLKIVTYTFREWQGFSMSSKTVGVILRDRTLSYCLKNFTAILGLINHIDEKYEA